MEQIKLLKGVMKKKIKITEAMLVSFLITGSFGFGENIPNKESVFIDKTLDMFKENDINGVVQTDENIKIQDHLIIEVENGNGLKGDVLIKGKSIENRGSIFGKSTLYDIENSGNGISTNNFIINNYGIVKGEGSGEVISQTGRIQEIGNGILVRKFDGSDSKSQDNLKNYGIISGEIKIKVKDLENEIKLEHSGSGIRFENLYSIRDYNLKNHGVILGSVTLNDFNKLYLRGLGNGVDTCGGLQNNLINTGFILGKSKLFGNSSYVSTIGNGFNNLNLFSQENGYTKTFYNKGIIKGESEVSLLNSKQPFQTTQGNGAFIWMVDNAINTGLMTGNYCNYQKIEAKVSNSGNGIVFGNYIKDSFLNKGVISGFVHNNGNEELYISGNGIKLVTGSYPAESSNLGVIKGSLFAIYLQEEEEFSGTLFKNYGLMAGREILGQQNPTYTDQIEPLTKFDKNYGTYIKLAKDGETNVALDIDGDAIVSEIIISKETPLDFDKTILNAEAKDNIDGNGTAIKDSYFEISENTSYKNYVINGVGMKEGVLSLKEGAVLKLDNSIVNAYKTAVDLKNNASLIAVDTIFNGGGLGKLNDNGKPDDNMDNYFEYAPIIKGDVGNNNLEILGNSIVNGAIDLGEGNDKLVISNATQINGDILGGLGQDTLELGNGTELVTNVDGNDDGVIDFGDRRGLSIYHEILNFEDIKVSGAVTLYETSKIIGETNLHIGKKSSLNLRIDPTMKDEKGRVIGHALYTQGDKWITAEKSEYDDALNEYWQDGDKKTSLTGGALNIITNGLGVGGVIAMSGKDIGTVHLDANKENMFIRTDSIIHSATVYTGIEKNMVYPNAEIGDITVTVNSDLIVKEIPPTEEKPPVNGYSVLRYNQLNKIYKSLIASNENINAIYPTTSISLLKEYLDYPVQSESEITNLALGNLLTLLNEIYTATPYSYSPELSKESLGMYSNLLLGNSFKAKEDNWMVLGGPLGEGTDLKDKYYAKNYHGFDTLDKSSNVEINNKIVGGYALGEYGLDKDLSLGVILGGSNNKANVSNGSRLDGNAFQIGGYFKNDINNLRILGGIGYQIAEYDSKRKAGNMMQSFSYENKFDNNGLNIYLGGTYKYLLGDNYYLVPKLKLSYTYIDQDSIREEDSPLAMNVSSKSFDTLESMIGMDLKKEYFHDKGKSTVSVGWDYTRILKGDKEEYLEGNMENGSKFDILIPNKLKNKHSLGVGYEFENDKGLLLYINGKYSFEFSEKNTIEGGDKTKNKKEEWITSMGIGYKFDTGKDLVPKIINIPKPVEAPIPVYISVSKELRAVPIYINEINNPEI